MGEGWLAAQGVSAADAINALHNAMSSVPSTALTASDTFTNLQSSIDFAMSKVGDTLNTYLMPIAEKLIGALTEAEENGSLAALGDSLGMVADSLVELFNALMGEDNLEDSMTSLAHAISAVNQVVTFFVDGISDILRVIPRDRGFMDAAGPLQYWLGPGFFNAFGKEMNRPRQRAQDHVESDAVLEDAERKKAGQVPRTAPRPQMRAGLGRGRPARQHFGPTPRSFDGPAPQGPLLDFKELTEQPGIEIPEAPLKEMIASRREEKEIAKAQLQALEVIRINTVPDLRRMALGGGNLGAQGVSVSELSDIRRRDGGAGRAERALMQAIGAYMDHFQAFVQWRRG